MATRDEFYKRRVKAIDSMSKLWNESDNRILELEQQLAELIVNANATPLVISPESTPITKEALENLGLYWRPEHIAFFANIGRLFVYIRESGKWYANSTSTYGGTVSSYRNLQSMEEVTQLLHLFGCNQTGREPWKLPE